MINDIIKIISSFIYPKNIDIYSLETDYMDVYETNFKDLYEMRLNQREKNKLLKKISYLSTISEYEIDMYSETIAINHCNLNSTIECQLDVLRRLHTNEQYRKQMIDSLYKEPGISELCITELPMEELPIEELPVEELPKRKVWQRFFK